MIIKSNLDWILKLPDNNSSGTYGLTKEQTKSELPLKNSTSYSKPEPDTIYISHNSASSYFPPPR